jgi:hypothetical protein
MYFAWGECPTYPTLVTALLTVALDKPETKTITVMRPHEVCFYIAFHLMAKSNEPREPSDCWILY